MRIGKHVEQTRRARGLSLNALAMLADLNPGAIREIERGHRQPTLATLIAIADALAMPLDELIGRKVPAPRSMAGIGRLTGESGSVAGQRRAS